MNSLSEEQCFQWLIDIIYPNGIFCEKCSKVTKHYRVTGRRTYACYHCRSQISPTANTIFHKSTTPLTSWFYAICLLNDNPDMSAKQLERELNVKYPTAWRIKRLVTLMESNLRVCLLNKRKEVVKEEAEK